VTVEEIFMEQKRLLVAIGISFAVFFLWSTFFAPKSPQAPLETTPLESEAQPSLPKDAPSAPANPAPLGTAPAVVEPAVSVAPARKISVDTPLYRMEFSEKGATIKSVVLKGYRETLADDSPLKELLADDLIGGTMRLALSGEMGRDLVDATYTADLQGERVEVGNQPVTIRFRHQSDSGLVVEKVFTFRADTYLVDLEVMLYNGSNQSMAGNMTLGLGNVMEDNASGYGFSGPSGLINGKLAQVKIKKIKDKEPHQGKIRWVALEGRYFMTSLILKEPLDGDMVPVYSNKQIENQMVLALGDVAPQETKTFELSLFAGPKSLKLLKSLKCELERAIDFGWVDFFAKPCLWFMNFIYGYIPNYGIAIIILTLVTRAMFWPLAQKSYKSMGAMRKLQPLMQELREKHKDDKARMNQELMALYKTYKVNPMGGCLPMVIQLPVFFALYRMLYQAIELRHAPFFGWITDLSAPDRLFEFSFKIPFMQPPYGIPVLTIVMGASMLLQQKMSPAAGDPTQAKMMMLMPVVFTFIFINFSSGLVLYWLVSNIFSMAQQYYTQQKMA
jgi:YidC/Oxa1 family membrane protein insertase